MLYVKTRTLLYRSAKGVTRFLSRRYQAEFALLVQNVKLLLASQHNFPKDHFQIVEFHKVRNVIVIRNVFTRKHDAF